MHEEHTALYDWLLFGHTVAAMAWLGSLVTLTVFAIGVSRSDDPAAVPNFFRSVRMVAPWVFGLSTFLVIALGLWMVFDSDEWSLGQTWVWLGLLLFAAAIVVGALIAGRANKRAERASADGDRAEATRQLRRWALGMGLVLLVLITAVWDMVFRPGV
ncbi:MAG TPA: DUF2269 family protein [Actinomycetes bacterium]|jgi:uncharacterized membrane protein|nr:DUF2269 family protein [Actinomycetes bacterium]